MTGFKADDALAGSNPIELPATGKASKGPAVRMTAGSYHTMPYTGQHHISETILSTYSQTHAHVILPPCLPVCLFPSYFFLSPSLSLTHSPFLDYSFASYHTFFSPLLFLFPFTHAHTLGNLKDLKHDLNVLKQISDLRVATVTKDRKYQYALHGNAERRDARKELRRLAKAELNHDETIDKKMREEEQAEMKELMKLKISDTAQPSLLVAARFLLDSYVNKLPVEKCQNCQKTVLPEIPEDDVTSKAQGNSAKEHSLKPMRTYCGHWLHFKCLNDWLTSPPFIRYTNSTPHSILLYLVSLLLSSFFFISHHHRHLTFYFPFSPVLRKSPTFVWLFSYYVFFNNSFTSFNIVASTSVLSGTFTFYSSLICFCFHAVYLFC